MQNQPGVFIVLEGSDGSGKGTQFRLLTERLRAVGHDVAIFDFPRYDEHSSHFVKRYLNGDYGPASDVSPYTASIFYALDRYEASPDIKKALKEGRVVLANRYVGSNMAHQGTKFSDLGQQRGFFMWAESLEYQLLGIPRPNLNLFLRVPANIAFELIANKSERSYTKKARDEHEADMGHIEKAVAAYDLLCNLFPKDFKKIDCVKGHQLLGVIQINNLIWATIKPLLPQPRREGKGSVIELDVAPPKPRTNVEPASVVSILQDISQTKLSTETLAGPLKLIKASPRNELDLLTNIINPSTIEGWSYAKKSQVFSRELPHLLDSVNYIFTAENSNNQLSVNARQLIKLKASDSKQFISMVEVISEIHPMLGRYIKTHGLATGTRRRHKRT